MGLLDRFFGAREAVVSEIRDPHIEGLLRWYSFDDSPAFDLDNNRNVHPFTVKVGEEGWNIHLCGYIDHALLADGVRERLDNYEGRRIKINYAPGYVQFSDRKGFAKVISGIEFLEHQTI